MRRRGPIKRLLALLPFGSRKYAYFDGHRISTGAPIQFTSYEDPGDGLGERQVDALRDMESGHHEDALNILTDVVTSRELKFGPKHPATLYSKSNHAFIHLSVGNPAEALKRYETLLPLMASVLGEFDGLTLLARRNQATALRDLGRTDDSIALYEDILCELERKFGQSSEDARICRKLLVKAYLDAGFKHHAIALQLENAEQTRRGWPESDLRPLAELEEAISMLIGEDRFVEAHSASKDLARRTERVLGKQNEMTGEMKEKSKGLRRAANRSRRLTKWHQNNVKDLRKRWGEDDQETLLAELDLAEQLREINDLNAAIRTLESALKRMEKSFSGDSQIMLIARTNLAQTYAQAWKINSAIATAEKAFEERGTLIGESNPHTVDARRLLSVLYRQAGETQKADALTPGTSSQG